MSKRDHDREFFDTDELLGDFTGEEREAQMGSNSLLGLSLGEYRARLARGEVERIDPDTGVVTFHPVNTRTESEPGGE